MVECALETRLHALLAKPPHNALTRALPSCLVLVTLQSCFSRRIELALVLIVLLLTADRYKEFLDSVTPAEWFAAQAEKQEVSETAGGRANCSKEIRRGTGNSPDYPRKT